MTLFHHRHLRARSSLRLERTTKTFPDSCCSISDSGQDFATDAFARKVVNNNG